MSTPRKRSRRRVGIKFASVLFGLAAALVFGEVAFRLVEPRETPYRVWRPNTGQVFHPRPGVMPGIQGPSRFTVNSVGIRAREVNADDRKEYRILAIGGSTTECLYLDDSKTWPFLLEKSLLETSDGRAVWVGNAGKSGRNSRDHVLHMKYLTAQHPKVDAVILLVGINDLTVSLAQDDHYVVPPPLTDADAERRQIQRAFAIAPGTPHAPWYKRTATYQVLKRSNRVVSSVLTTRGLTQDESGEALVKWRARRNSASQILDRLPDLNLPLADYRRNLNAIVDIARARSLRLILLTQPVIWSPTVSRDVESLLWLGGVGEFNTERGKPHAYFAVSVLSEAMRRFNAALLEVCGAREVECMDLAAAIPKDRSMFYDDAHFTELGAQKIAQTIADELKRRPPFWSE